MILHLDMDAFFASVEQLDNPDLVGKPVIIGGEARGVVATASYEARVYGIHSAMPIAVARRLCPHGIFMKGHGSRYSEISHLIMGCLQEFSPVVQCASIDEAYLDLGHTQNYEAFARNIKKRIFDITGGLTCSIGIAPVKFLAKICSDLRKPDGIYILEADGVDDFLLPMRVEKLPGVGKSMCESLHKFGIYTIAQLRKLGLEYLETRYGKWGRTLYERARGRDSRCVHPNAPAKSESAERTFAEDVIDRGILRNALLAHAERVSARLRKQAISGRTVTLKIKFSDFGIISRSITLEIPTNSTTTIYNAGCSLLAAVKLRKPVRLIGLGIAGFDQRTFQPRLPGLEREKPEALLKAARLDTAVDLLTSKFGKGIVTRASALGMHRKSNHNFGG